MAPVAGPSRSRSRITLLHGSAGGRSERHLVRGQARRTKPVGDSVLNIRDQVCLRGTASVERSTSTLAPTALIENGFVYIPETAPWLAKYLHEMTLFPKGKHYDQVDSTAQFLDWFKKADAELGHL